MRIAFALVAHSPTDERVYYQQAESLKQAGCEVFILSTRLDHCEIPGIYCFDDRGMSKTNLIKKLSGFLFACDPDVIICDNPMAILAANNYRKSAKKSRVLYDITEWYPSKKNLQGFSFLRKIIKSFALTFLSFYASRPIDGFIFGEFYKARPFRILFPRKKFIYLSYYASLEFIVTYPMKDISSECNFFYAGSLTEDKGFDKVIEVAVMSAQKHPETRFKLQVITRDLYDNFSTNVPENLVIRFSGTLDFLPFCREIGTYDIFLDLRKNDMENTRCLPIKLFYYMACGRPVIYTCLKSIPKEVPEINEIGFLADPRETDEIVAYISSYVNDSRRYKQHGVAARKLAEEKYNWERIKGKFTQFVMNHECV